MSTKANNALTKSAWNHNANLWDSRMGSEGNDFFKQLQYPFILDYLGLSEKASNPKMNILDISCGNGILSRKLAGLGADVTGIDFSEALIELAEGYTPGVDNPRYAVADVTVPEELARWSNGNFDAAVCNMALFDIADIEPLIRALPKMLKPGGMFIFSILHPAFNNSSTVKLLEEYDDGEVKQRYALKIDKYLSIYDQKGVALRGQEMPQVYFNRPMQYYLKLCFDQGFVMDRFDEPALERLEGGSPLSWGSNLAEIPPVMLARMRLPRT